MSSGAKRGKLWSQTRQASEPNEASFGAKRSELGAKETCFETAAVAPVG